MQNLPDLIDEVLAKNHQGKAEFCDAIGISRSTLARWDASLPGPPTLRAIAQHLDVPYREVIAAALTGAGYLTADADALTVDSISIVVNDGDPEDDDLYAAKGLPAHGAVAAFSAPAAAEQYAVNANKISAPHSDFLVVTLPINSASAPIPIAVHTAWWNSASDTITCRENFSAAVPERLRHSSTTPVTATIDADSGLITGLSLSSLDPTAGRLILEQFLTALREQEQLAPPPLPADRARSSSPIQMIPSDFAQRPDLPPTVDVSWNRYFAPQHLARTPHELLRKLLRNNPGTPNPIPERNAPGETPLNSPIFSDPGTLDLPLSTESVIVIQGPSSSGKLHTAILLARGIAAGRRPARIIAGSGKGTPISEQPYLTDAGSIESALSEGLSAQERRLTGGESNSTPLILVLGSMLFPESTDPLSASLQRFVSQCAATASAVILTTNRGELQQDRIASALPDHTITFIQL